MAKGADRIAEELRAAITQREKELEALRAALVALNGKKT